MTEKKVVRVDELDWIRTRADRVLAYEEERMSEKLVRKVKENPLIPIGCAATVGALSYGLYSFVVGNRQHSQYAMRARVAFQAFTLCTVAYALYKTQNSNLGTKQTENKTDESIMETNAISSTAV